MQSKPINYFSIGKIPGKIPELDGVRAIAILLVLGHHFATFYREYYGSYYRNAIDGSLENGLLNGWLGVDLFFVLSGYLIFRHLLQSQQNQNSSLTLKQYALKRVLRTFPLYYAMILIAYLGIIPYYDRDFSWVILMKHVFFIQDYSGNEILTPMWSLATEEKFYLLAPFLLFLTRFSLQKTVGILVALITLIATFRWMHISTAESIGNHIAFFLNYRAPFHYAIIAILVGVLIALIENQPAHKILSYIAPLAVLVLMVCLLSLNLYSVENWRLLSVGHLVIIVLFGLLIYASIKHSGNPWLRILRGRFLRIIAVLSYSLYLVHYTILPWTLRLHRTHIYSETPWVHAISFFGIYIALACSMATLLYLLIEKPFLTIKDKI